MKVSIIDNNREKVEIFKRKKNTSNESWSWRLSFSLAYRNYGGVPSTAPICEGRLPRSLPSLYEWEQIRRVRLPNTSPASLHLKLRPILTAQSMEILRHGRSLQPESEMSLHAGQHRDKYFYDGNDFLETNEGDKAIREILHLLEEREETYQSAGEESGTSLHHFLQHAILCASILCVILIIAIFLVHSITLHIQKTKIQTLSCAV